MEERQIGTTELRQRLTDVLQAVKEEKVAYVVETFGRPQAVLIDLDEYERLQEYWTAHESFLDKLLAAGEANAELNRDLSEQELLAIIDAARAEVYNESH